MAQIRKYVSRLSTTQLIPNEIPKRSFNDVRHRKQHAVKFKTHENIRSPHLCRFTAASFTTDDYYLVVIDMFQYCLKKMCA